MTMTMSENEHYNITEPEFDFVTVGLEELKSTRLETKSKLWKRSRFRPFFMRYFLQKNPEPGLSHTEHEVKRL